MLNALPDGFLKYSETPVFTDATVPEKLTKEHRTKSNVWGRLMVISGGLDYVIPGPPEETTRINVGEFGIIEPAQIHYVRISGVVSFRVEFFKQA